MSASPFILQAGEFGAYHVINISTHKCLATLKGKTARKRALRVLEWLRVGYFSVEISKKID